MIASKFMIFFRLSILFAYAAAPGQLKCAGEVRCSAGKPATTAPALARLMLVYL